MNSGRHRSSLPQTERSLWDKIWKDNNGHVVIWQIPNVPLWVWIVFTVFSLFFSGRLADFFSWIASAGLIVWALLEVFRGVNYFRRSLGLIVLAFSIASVIKLITA